MRVKINRIMHTIIHFVGNKGKDEGVNFSNDETSFDNIEKDICNTFQESFHMEEKYCFFSKSNLNDIPTFVSVKSIFNDHSSFIIQSRNIANLLYEKSLHPKIKPGEVCFLLLDCEVDGNSTEALCILKYEKNQRILQLKKKDNNYLALIQEGFSLKKLEKGCIIFNVNPDLGYQISLLSGVKKQEEAKYWLDEFLQCQPISNEYRKTECLLEAISSYITDEVPLFCNANKLSQFSMLNNCGKSIKSNEVIDINELGKSIFEDEELQKDFSRYIDEYQSENNISLDTPFNASKSAIKRKKIDKPRLIKLDGSFEIRIRKNSEMIENGYDEEKKMNFYKIYYRSEE